MIEYLLLRIICLLVRVLAGLIGYTAVFGDGNWLFVLIGVFSSGNSHEEGDQKHLH